MWYNGCVKDLEKEIIDFVTERNWKQFHTPKDLALSLMLEAGELLEIFQWKNDDEQNNIILNKKQEISNEMSDIFYYLILMSKYYDIDIIEALKLKMKENKMKYPIDKSKGRSLKYNEL